MLVQCSIRLPRDVEVVTTFRHDLDQALLNDLGVAGPSREDIGLVVSEVCANVMAHLARGDQYDIDVLADEFACVVEVREVAHGRQMLTSADNALASSGSGLRIVTGVAASVDVNVDDHPGLLRRVTVTFAEPTAGTDSEVAR